MGFCVLKKIVLILVCITLCCSQVYSAEEFNYAKYQGNVDLQNIFADYMVSVRSKIQKNWNPPDYLEKDGHALVKFGVTRHGYVFDVEMLETSGDIVFDESAKEAIRKAEPFDKFPANTSKGSLMIKYSFDTAVANTGNMHTYCASADKLYNINNELALAYINKAIAEVEGDTNSYYLYGKRSKIKRALGDIDGAEEDLAEAKRLKAKFDKKRIMATKVVAEMEQSAYSYFSLAHAYEIAEDYDNAIIAIDKAISLTDLNNTYKRYRAELVQKQRPRY